MKQKYIRISRSLQGAIDKLDFSSLTDEVYNDAVWSTNADLKAGNTKDLPVTQGVCEMINKYIPKEIAVEWVSKHLLLAMYKNRNRIHKREICAHYVNAARHLNRLQKERCLVNPKATVLLKDVAQEYGPLPIEYKYKLVEIVKTEVVNEIKDNKDIIVEKIKATPKMGGFASGRLVQSRLEAPIIEATDAIAKEYGVSKIKMRSYIVKLAINKLKERYDIN